MENINNNTFKSIFIDIVSVLSIVSIFVYAIRTVRQNTKTEIISDKALEVINDKEESKKLREAIRKYHETGDWNKTNIKEIL